MSGVPIENFYSNHYLKTTIMSLLYSKNFPNDWTKEKIERYVNEIATDPKVPWKQISLQDRLILLERRKFIAEDVREGRKIRVILEPNDRGILTAYPLD